MLHLLQDTSTESNANAAIFIFIREGEGRIINLNCCVTMKLIAVINAIDTNH